MRIKTDHVFVQLECQRCDKEIRGERMLSYFVGADCKIRCSYCGGPMAMLDYVRVIPDNMSRTEPQHERTANDDFKRETSQAGRFS